MGERTIQSGVEITNEEFYALMDGYNGIRSRRRLRPTPSRSYTKPSWPQEPAN